MRGGSAAAVVRAANKKKKDQAHRVQRDILDENIQR